MIPTWQWTSFDSLTKDALYKIMQARQAVFTVEQDCPYQDADGLDQLAWHLLGWAPQGDSRSLVAYLRVVHPNHKYPEPSIGRVLTMPSSRGTGAGSALLEEAIRQVELEYPNTAIRISAQRHLENFYASVGFERVSDPYQEDGITHIEMLRQSSS